MGGLIVEGPLYMYICSTGKGLSNDARNANDSLKDIPNCQFMTKMCTVKLFIKILKYDIELIYTMPCTIANSY